MTKRIFLAVAMLFLLCTTAWAQQDADKAETLVNELLSTDEKASWVARKELIALGTPAQDALLESYFANPQNLQIEMTVSSIPGDPLLLAKKLGRNLGSSENDSVPITAYGILEEAAIQAMREGHDNPLPQIAADLLNSEDAQVRKRGVKILHSQWMPAHVIVQSAEKAISSPGHPHRDELLRLLEKHNAAGAVIAEDLINQLPNNENPDRADVVVSGALRAMGDSILPSLAEGLLASDSTTIRGECLNIIAAIGNEAEPIVPALVRALEDDGSYLNNNIGYNAGLTLGRMKSHDAILALCSALNNENDLVEKNALGGIRNLQFPHDFEGSANRDQIVNLLSSAVWMKSLSEDKEIVLDAAFAAASLNKQGVPFSAEKIADRVSHSEWKLKPLIEMLGRWLKDPEKKDEASEALQRISENANLEWNRVRAKEILQDKTTSEEEQKD